MLTLRSLPLRSAKFHWRANLPVLLGVAVGSAVLTGALVVGDSLRGSLRDRAERQLNGVRASYVGPRLIGQGVADNLYRTYPVLMLQGSARVERPDGIERRLGRVTVIGLDPEGTDIVTWPGKRTGALLSAAVAERLGVRAGDSIELGLEKSSAVPRSSLLGKRGLDDVTTAARVTVAEVLAPGHRANDFSLVPNPTAPLNVFVPLSELQTLLKQPGKVNALLAARGSVDSLNEQLRNALTLDDWGIRLRPGGKPAGYVSAEAEALVLDPPAVRAVEAAAKAIGSRSERTFTYLANTIAAGMQPVWNADAGDPDRQVAYSTVAALNPAAAAPLGPFLPPGVSSLSDDEIVLVDWSDSPLKKMSPPLKPGDPVTVTFFKPEMEANVEEGSATFRFAGWVPFRGAADDPDLTPPYPGITDALSIDKWVTPFDGFLNNRRIRPRDDKFWKDHKATPKAYVTLAAGQKLWGSRFGDVTSVRGAPAPGQSVDDTLAALRAELPKHLDPAAAGFVFEPTRERMLAASKGGTDFGGLFLGFSFFLIGAALLLVGLLFRLALDRRAKEVGLLLAAGFPQARIRRLLMTEGLAVAAAGALLGLAAAVGYAHAMVRVLTELWPSGEVGRFLTVHVQPGTLAVGFAATLLVATVTIRFSLRGLVAVAPPALLRGETAVAETAADSRKPWKSVGVGAVSLLAGAALLATGGAQPNPDLRAMTFFSGGGLLLVAGLAAGRAWLRWPRQSVVTGRGLTAMAGLGRRNATRNPTRSLLTAALIAAATFLLVAVESFRRRPDADFLRETGGSGGFRLLAEADVPVFRPFDTEAGHDDILEHLQKAFGGSSTDPRLAKAQETLEKLSVLPFRLQGGDDASCLNLYQAGRPRVLGVPDALVARGGFAFAQTEAETPEEKANPWLLLTKPQADGAVPVFAEQNTVMWMLKTGVGGELTQPDGDGHPVTLRIVGTLQDSVFQSELLMSDANFRRLYPRQEGFRTFLLNGPDGQDSEVAGLLETGLRANGLTVTPTTDRVAAFQAVVGTYLTTFQLLGGFGLLLGVLGLGVVVLRGVWERVGELALLRAVGYRTRTLQAMILSENLLLLLLGLGVGVAAAVASVLPNLALGGSLDGGRLAALLAAVFAAGLGVAVAATGRVARVPLVPALRKE